MLDILAHAAAEAEHHTEAAAFGISLLTPGFFVALAMLVVFAIMLRAGVPGLIARALDARIADISKQLEEAARLRAEAEALRDEYARRSREAAAEIVAIREATEHQAQEIVEKAKRDSAALVERRKAIAENKIAAAELAAVEEIRATAASAAAGAARKLIAEKHGAAADRKLVDEAISNL